MIEIKVTVVLGSPASNCAKYGICSIEEEKNPAAWEAFAPLHHRHVKAVISRSETGMIQFCFPVASMHPVTPGMFFSSAGFVIESSDIIPETITQQLFFPLGSRFSTGIWPVNSENDAFVVLVPCVVKQLMY